MAKNSVLRDIFTTNAAKIAARVVHGANDKDKKVNDAARIKMMAQICRGMFTGDVESKTLKELVDTPLFVDTIIRVSLESQKFQDTMQWPNLRPGAGKVVSAVQFALHIFSGLFKADVGYTIANPENMCSLISIGCRDANDMSTAIVALGLVQKFAAQQENLRLLLGGLCGFVLSHLCSHHEASVRLGGTLAISEIVSNKMEQGHLSAMTHMAKFFPALTNCVDDVHVATRNGAVKSILSLVLNGPTYLAHSVLLANGRALVKCMGKMDFEPAQVLATRALTKAVTLHQTLAASLCLADQGKVPVEDSIRVTASNLEVLVLETKQIRDEILGRGVTLINADEIKEDSLLLMGNTVTIGDNGKWTETLRLLGLLSTRDVDPNGTAERIEVVVSSTCSSTVGDLANAFVELDAVLGLGNKAEAKRRLSRITLPAGKTSFKENFLKECKKNALRWV